MTDTTTKTDSQSTQLVILVGNIASGKTTAMQLLANKLHLTTIDADSLFQTIDPFRENYLQNIKRWALTNELWLTAQRAIIMEKNINKNQSRQLLVDSGLLMSWVYTYSHLLAKNITLAEWELYEQIYTLLTKDILSNCQLIFLDYSIKTLLARIKKRGRDYELQYYSAKYLNQIQNGLQALILMAKKQGLPVLKISENKIGDFENKPTDQIKLIKQVSKIIK
jgi:deoxyadenosine/deoxycytidine kinase